MSDDPLVDDAGKPYTPPQGWSAYGGVIEARDLMGLPDAAGVIEAMCDGRVHMVKRASETRWTIFGPELAER